MGTPTSNSSRQIVHSAESTQSFSVATYGNIPVLLGGGGGGGGDAPSPLLGLAAPAGGVLPYPLRVAMQMVMWASRRASKLGRVRSGSSRWQTGHSSSSAICGRGWGMGGSLRLTREAEDEGPGPPKLSNGRGLSAGEV